MNLYLQLLLRRSLDSGKDTDRVHSAFITPIFKSGDKSEPVNYQPVSLTNHITKLFERIIEDEIVFYLTGQLNFVMKHNMDSANVGLNKL